LIICIFTLAKKLKEELLRNNSERENQIKKEIVLLTMEEVAEITGWSIGVVKEMFAHDNEFPAIKKGKQNQVLLESLKQYLSVRRVSR